MIAYRAEDDDKPPRPHPWTTAIDDPTHRYVDFKLSPELIRTALEDFRAYRGQPFASAFFRLVAWLNSPGVTMESNDCAFRGPEANTDRQFPSRLRACGRLMILYRELLANTRPESIQWLITAAMQEIEAIEPSFRLGAVGISKSRAAYIGFHSNPKFGTLGDEVVISFWAYGNNPRKCLASMNTVIATIDVALRSVDGRLRRGEHVPDISNLVLDS